MDSLRGNKARIETIGAVGKEKREIAAYVVEVFIGQSAADETVGQIAEQQQHDRETDSGGQAGQNRAADKKYVEAGGEAKELEEADRRQSFGFFVFLRFRFRLVALLITLRRIRTVFVAFGERAIVLALHRILIDRKLLPHSTCTCQ